MGITSLLRRHSPAVRHTVWTVGFLLALLVPAGGFLLPSRSLGLLHYPPALTTSTAAGGGSAGLEAAAPFPGLPTPTGSMDFPGPLRTLSGAGEIPGIERLGAGLATGFLLLWGLGALVLVLRLVGHRIQVGRLTRRGTSAAPDDGPARVARREAARMGIRRHVGVVYTSELAVPVTWGVLRPILLLPPDATTWSETRLHAVLVHELAHVRRWDALSQQLAELARALYWANPLAWIGRRLAARERESACDDEVLRGGMASSDYAGVLVAMARRSTVDPRGLRQEFEGGLALAGPSRLEARVSAVLEGTAGARRFGRSVTTASCLALTLVAAPLAGVSVVAESPVSPSEDPGLSLRLRTVQALGVECDEVSLWTLARTVQEDPAPSVRKAAVRALAMHDDPRSVHVLIHAADDRRQDPAVRRAALLALAHRDSRDAADALIARLRDDDAVVRRTAVRAMGRMELQSGRVRGPIAMVMLADRDPAVRAAAAAALQHVGCDDSLLWLRRALKDPSPAVVRRAERALERLGGH